MYKVTVNGKTIVGCNEDAWRTTSSIWFENAKNENEYAASFTGSRKAEPNRFAPQSGMNEMGLVFSRLTAYHPKQKGNNKKKIRNEVLYLSNILHQCKTVQDVKKFIEEYDHSLFIDDVFIYIDKTGDYIVVEPYQIIHGNDSSYVLSNFCPSQTSNQNARKLDRYQKGEDFLNAHKPEATQSFCKSMSDTMHVCRDRNGDGTLLTSIWDTENHLVNLYFYHDYDSTVQFNLSEELALGDHIISIPNIFSKNMEYEHFKQYKTPFNVPPLRILLAITGGLIFCLSFLYLINYFRRKRDAFNITKILYATFNLILTLYLFVLATNKDIYYFDAPFQHYKSDLISLSSYIPFLLLLVIIPFTFLTVRYIKTNRENILIKSCLILNYAIYALLILGFVYWGLYIII
jgi:hypothetical protein